MQSAVLPALPPAEAWVVDGEAGEEAGVPVVVAVLLQPPSASTAATKAAAVSEKVREPPRPPEIPMRASMPAPDRAAALAGSDEAAAPGGSGRTARSRVPPSPRVLPQPPPGVTRFIQHRAA